MDRAQQVHSSTPLDVKLNFFIPKKQPQSSIDTKFGHPTNVPQDVFFNAELP